MKVRDVVEDSVNYIFYVFIVDEKLIVVIIRVEIMLGDIVIVVYLND